jgi:protease PrsW
VGASIGVAACQPTVRRKVVTVASGLAVAIAGHLVWDVSAMARLFWRSDHPSVELFLAEPANLVVFKGPLFVALMVLTVMGLRQESRGLVAGLRSEVATGYGAITPDEMALLANPRRRWKERMATLRRSGFGAYRRLRTVHRAQIELALLRWKRRNGMSTEPWQAESVLRDRIRPLRYAPAPPLPALQPATGA